MSVLQAAWESLLEVVEAPGASPAHVDHATMTLMQLAPFSTPDEVTTLLGEASELSQHESFQSLSGSVDSLEADRRDGERRAAAATSLAGHDWKADLEELREKLSSALAERSSISPSLPLASPFWISCSTSGLK